MTAYQASIPYRTALPYQGGSGNGWRLVQPTRLDRYLFEPQPGHRQYVNNLVSFTIYGSGGTLVAVEAPDGNDLAAAQYVYLGGHENITTDPAIRAMWLSNGFEVENV